MLYDNSIGFCEAGSVFAFPHPATSNAPAATRINPKKTPALLVIFVSFVPAFRAGVRFEI